MQTIGDADPSEVSLYFHIPFCTRKCDYCHFYVLPEDEKNKELLLEGFFLEWQTRLPFLKDKHIATLYFGGGTPSLFGPHRLTALLNEIKQQVSLTSPDLEITLEVNPENCSLSLMQAYREAGINRVSIGIQTLNADLLQLLGRTHNVEMAIDAIYTTQEAGISNISIDLMYDLPKQTFNHWESTLQALIPLPITHLSLYNLTIEPHTLFFKKQDQLRPWMPDEKTSLAMYERAVEVLENKGLEQYEISAFAQPGFHSKHNVGYWIGRPFLGFGPSAFSYWEGQRFRNCAHLKRYYDQLKSSLSPIDFEEKLDPAASLKELFVIQLRLRRGVDLSAFQARHGSLDKATWQTLEQCIQRGWIESKPHQIRLTKQGILFYDTIAAELI